MNFSEPGCAITTTNINGSTPLHLARTLFSDIAYPTKLADFTRHLTAIHNAAYLLLLPQESRAEVDFHQAETRRISTGPLGDAVLKATTLFFLNSFRRNPVNNNANNGNNDDENAETIVRTDQQQQNGDDTTSARTQNENIYEATGLMLADLAAEEERYLDNMTILLAVMKLKWKTDLLETGSHHRTALHLGKSGIASATALSSLVSDRAPAPYHERYLSEIAQYWRKWMGGEAGEMERGRYEEVWVYVAGRGLGGE